MNNHVKGPWTFDPLTDSDLPGHVGISSPEHGAFAHCVWKMEGDTRSIRCEQTAVLMREAANLLSALRTMVAAVDTKEPEAFPGHHKAYLEQVALPRARYVLRIVDDEVQPSACAPSFRP